MRTKSLNNAQCFVLDNAQHAKMISSLVSSRKRKWRYRRASRPKRIRRLRKEDDDIQKFVTWCKEVGIRISKQVWSRALGSCTIAILCVTAGIDN